jgi:cytochrome c2
MRLLATALIAALLCACAPVAVSAELGDARRGAKLIGLLGCGGCHGVDGVKDAVGNVGPPLTHVGTRVYLAGVLENTPRNMVAWLRSPQKFVPRNAMPDIGLSEADARDIAAYLYQLK